MIQASLIFYVCSYQVAVYVLTLMDFLINQCLAIYIRMWIIFVVFRFVMRYQHHSRGTSNHLLLSHLLGFIINHFVSLIFFCVFLLLSKTECLIVVVRKYKRVGSIRRGKLFCFKARNEKRVLKFLKESFLRQNNFWSCFFPLFTRRYRTQRLSEK